MNQDIWSTLFLLLVMIAVLFGAYYTTKFISSKSTRMTKNKYIRVIDRMIVSKDKQIVLLEVGDKFFLVGFTNQAINVIGTFDDDSIQIDSDKKQDVTKKGVVSFITTLVKKAKEDQDSLYKARKERKQTAQPIESFLDEMNRSVEQRKNRLRQQTDKKDDSDNSGKSV